MGAARENDPIFPAQQKEFFLYNFEISGSDVSQFYVFANSMFHGRRSRDLEIDLLIKSTLKNKYRAFQVST